MKAAACAAFLAIVVAALGPTSAAAKVTDLGVWSRAPDMLAEHVGHTATLLKDGRVLIAGGTDLEGTATAECELYDPKTNRWTEAASMNFARAYHTATLLKNGDVLVVGGQSSTSAFPYTVLASAEIYQPAQNRWIKVRSAHVARARHSAVLLPDGRVLVVGGNLFVTGDLILPDAAAVPAEDRAEIYNPNTPHDPYHDPWSPAGIGMPDFEGAAFTALTDGEVLATGGVGTGGFASDSADVFNPKTDSWQPARSRLAKPRSDHTATLLPDGWVILIGGRTAQPSSDASPYPESTLVDTTEFFDVRGNYSNLIGHSKTPRIEHTATLLHNGLVLVVGSAYASDADSELFDPVTARFVSTGVRMDRYLHTATLLTDGRVLIAGGFGVGSQKTAWVYSPISSLPASTPLGGSLQVATVALLIVLIALGFLATSGRARWPKRRPSDDAEWIEP